MGLRKRGFWKIGEGDFNPVMLALVHIDGGSIGHGHAKAGFTWVADLRIAIRGWIALSAGCDGKDEGDGQGGAHGASRVCA